MTLDQQQILAQEWEGLQGTSADLKPQCTQIHLLTPKADNPMHSNTKKRGGRIGDLAWYCAYGCWVPSNLFLAWGN